MKFKYETRCYDTLASEQQFCCDRMKTYFRDHIFLEIDGKMVIRDYDPHSHSSVIPISFCPFCGEKFE